MFESSSERSIIANALGVPADRLPYDLTALPERFQGKIRGLLAGARFKAAIEELSAASVEAGHAAYSAPGMLDALAEAAARVVTGAAAAVTENYAQDTKAAQEELISIENLAHAFERKFRRALAAAASDVAVRADEAGVGEAFVASARRNIAAAVTA